MNDISAAQSIDTEDSNFKIFTIGLLGAWLLRLIYASLRWKTVGIEGDNRYWPCGDPRIMAFWHDQQLLMPWIYRRGRIRGKTRPMAVLISQHRDGRIIAKAVKFLGIDSISGSSTRRGYEAFLELTESLKSGSHISITPDGPRGPRHKLKAGIVRIAQRSRVPIYPVAVAVKDKWSFKSWDKMFFPKPFTKAVAMFGDAITIPAEMSEEDIVSYSQIVEDALNAVTQKAEEYILNL